MVWTRTDSKQVVPHPEGDDEGLFQEAFKTPRPRSDATKKVADV